MCGLIGYSSEKNNFDLQKIYTLLYVNSKERDSADGCGIYTNAMTEPYKNCFSAKTMLYNNSIKDNIKESNLLIGHVRKSSSGGSTSVNAHPYKINNIIGAHNGTLSNEKEICRKFEVNYEHSKTDSYHLFKAIAKCGNPSPLRFSEGSLAVIFTDELDKNTLYVYRNSDRTLFYGMIGEDMYISSDTTALSIIQCTDVKSFESDVFYIIQNGKIQNSIKFSQKVRSTRWDNDFLYKWVKVKDADISRNLDPDEFYFISSFTSSYTHGGESKSYFTITGGIGLDGTIITLTNPIKNVPRELIDESYTYDYDVDKNGFICAKILTNLEFTDKTELDKDTDVIITGSDGFGLNKKLDIYVPSLDRHFTKVELSDIRPCTTEESKEIISLLQAFYDDGGKEILEKIKFNDLMPETINQNLCEFNLNLITTLDKLKEEKDVEKIQKSITTIMDDAEQVVQNYIN